MTEFRANNWTMTWRMEIAAGGSWHVWKRSWYRPTLVIPTKLNVMAKLNSHLLVQRSVMQTLSTTKLRAGHKRWLFKRDRFFNMRQQLIWYRTDQRANWCAPICGKGLDLRSVAVVSLYHRWSSWCLPLLFSIAASLDIALGLPLRSYGPTLPSPIWMLVPQ